MAATRYRLFPRPPLAAPSTNGKHAHAPAVEAKSLIWAPHAQFYPDGMGGVVDASLGSLDWYAAAWLAYACMRYRATKLTEAPLWIAEEKDGAEEWVEGDHPLAELLERPNPDMEMADLMEVTSLYLDSTGAALWVKNRDRSGRVASLYPFSGEEFEVKTADGRLYGRFEVRAKGGKQVLGPDDVVHFRNANPADVHGAVAPLHAALARLGIDRSLVEAIKGGLRNAVVPGMSFEFPPTMPLTPEQHEQFNNLLTVKYAEAKNHGKSIVGNFKATRHTLGFDGLNGGELAKEVEAAVCACFQLPPVVIGAFVGLTNSSDRHNLETSVVLVYDNAIIPTWTRMERAMTRGLLREVDPNPLRFVRFDKSQIKALQDDRGAQAEIIEKAGAALLVNDARAMLGLAPLDDERGERLLLGGGAPAVPGMEPEEELEPEEEEPEAEDEEKSRRPGQSKAISDDELRIALFDESTRAQEMGWLIETANQLQADRTAILSLFPAAKALERKDDDPAGADFVRSLVEQTARYLDMTAKARWEERIRPLTEATARRAAERVAAEVGVSFDLLQPGLEKFVQREAAWLVTQVTDTTKQAIRDALAAGLLEGESIPKLAARLRDSGAFARSRAELIARTETTRVTNGGQRESLAEYQRETGDRITKRWLATRDARTRDEHRDLDGETVGIDEEFSNGLMAPGEPNCRCTLVYAMEAA